MPVDRRFREALEHSAAVVQPDVNTGLPDAIVRGRRRRRTRLGTMAVAIVASAALIAFLASALDSVDNFKPEPATENPTPTAASNYRAIAGTYRTTLKPSSSLIRTHSMAGGWTLRLRASGLVLLSAPSRFDIPTDGIAFQLIGGRFRTNAFVNSFDCPESSIGTYTWSRTASTLVFRVVKDPCAVRIALLTSSPWRNGS